LVYSFFLLSEEDGYTGTDASNTHERVLYEKRYSLFLEGHRLTDMRHYEKHQNYHLIDMVMLWLHFQNQRLKHLAKV